MSICSGNIRDEPGAVVCRVSASFIRFGTFQLPASREEFHNIPRLADYVIRHHYPQFQGTHLPRCGVCLHYHQRSFLRVCHASGDFAASIAHPLVQRNTAIAWLSEHEWN